MSQKLMDVYASKSTKELGWNFLSTCCSPEATVGVLGKGTQQGGGASLAGAAPGACGTGLVQCPCARFSTSHHTRGAAAPTPHPIPMTPASIQCVQCHPAREAHSSWASSVGQVTTQEKMGMGTELESHSSDRGEQGKQAGQSPRTPAMEGGPAQGSSALHRRVGPVRKGTGALCPVVLGTRGRGPRPSWALWPLPSQKPQVHNEAVSTASTLIYPPPARPSGTLFGNLTSVRPSP